MVWLLRRDSYLKSKVIIGHEQWKSFISSTKKWKCLIKILVKLTFRKANNSETTLIIKGWNRKKAPIRIRRKSKKISIRIGRKWKKVTRKRKKQSIKASIRIGRKRKKTSIIIGRKWKKQSIKASVRIGWNRKKILIIIRRKWKKITIRKSFNGKRSLIIG